jgi:hypothetical protein
VEEGKSEFPVAQERPEEEAKQERVSLSAEVPPNKATEETPKDE